MVRKVKPRPYRQSLKKRRVRTRRKPTTKKSNAKSRSSSQATNATDSALPENYSTAKWERVFSCRKRTLMQKACDIENHTGCQVTLTVRSPSGDVWYYASNNKLKLQLLKSEIITSESARVTANTLKNQVLLPFREPSVNIEPLSRDEASSERCIPDSTKTCQDPSCTKDSDTSDINKRAESKIKSNCGISNKSTEKIIFPPSCTSGGAGNQRSESVKWKCTKVQNGFLFENFLKNNDITRQRSTSSTQHIGSSDLKHRTTSPSLKKVDATGVSSNQSFPAKHVSIPDNTVVLSSSSSSESTSSDSDSEFSASSDSEISSSDCDDNLKMDTQTVQQSITQTETMVTTIGNNKNRKLLHHSKDVEVKKPEQNKSQKDKAENVDLFSMPSNNKESKMSEIKATQPFVKIPSLGGTSCNNIGQTNSKQEKEDTQKKIVTQKSKYNSEVPFSFIINNSANKNSKPIAMAQPIIKQPKTVTVANRTQPRPDWRQSGTFSDQFSYGKRRKKYSQECSYSATETTKYFNQFSNFSGYNNHSKGTYKIGNWVGSHGNRTYESPMTKCQKIKTNCHSDVNLFGNNRTLISGYSGSSNTSCSSHSIQETIKTNNRRLLNSSTKRSSNRNSQNLSKRPFQQKTTHNQNEPMEQTRFRSPLLPTPSVRPMTLSDQQTSISQPLRGGSLKAKDGNSRIFNPSSALKNEPISIAAKEEPSTFSTVFLSIPPGKLRSADGNVDKANVGNRGTNATPLFANSIKSTVKGEHYSRPGPFNHTAQKSTSVRRPTSNVTEIKAKKVLPSTRYFYQESNFYNRGRKLPAAHFVKR